MAYLIIDEGRLGISWTRDGYSKLCILGKVVCFTISVLSALNVQATYPPSVTQIGYNSGQTSIAYSNSLTAEKFAGLSSVKFPLADKVVRLFPLFLNSKDLPPKVLKRMPEVRDKQILFVFVERTETELSPAIESWTPGFLRSLVVKLSDWGLVNSEKILKQFIVALDWKTKNELWRHPTATNIQNPILYLDKGRVYWAYYNTLNSIQVNGKGLQTLEYLRHNLINVDGIRLSRETVDQFLACRSALGILAHKSKPRLYMGCSTPPHPYRSHKGMRGMLVAFKLNAKGEFLPNATPKVFFPSRITEHPDSGYNTGIWNNGMNSPLSPDNSILVATSNGPIIPEEDNYGCSIIRLNPDSLKPEAKKQKGFSYYSSDTEGYRECFPLNMEVGSGAIAVTGNGQNLVAAVVGKDGILRVFSPDRLPGNKAEGRFELKVGGKFFGNLSLKAQTEKDFSIVIAGPAKPDKNEDSLIATEAAIKKLNRNDFEKVKCLGWGPNSKGTDSLKSQIFFSGPYRNNHVAIAENHSLYWNIESTIRPKEIPGSKQSPIKEVWPPFIATSSEFYLFRSSASPPKGHKLVPLYLHVSESEPYAISSLPKVKKSSRFVNKISDKANGFVWQDKNDSDCTTPPALGLDKVFLWTSRTQPAEENIGWKAQSFDFSFTGGLRKSWEFKADTDTIPAHTNFVRIENNNDEPGLILVTAHHAKGGKKSRVFVLNAETGKVLGQHDYSGRMHFNMPLVIDDHILIVTRNEGIKVFQARSQRRISSQ